MSAPPPLERGWHRRPRVPKPSDIAGVHLDPESPRKCTARDRQVETGDVRAQPGSSPPARPGDQPRPVRVREPDELGRRSAGTTADARPDRA